MPTLPVWLRRSNRLTSRNRFRLAPFRGRSRSWFTCGKRGQNQIFAGMTGQPDPAINRDPPHSRLNASLSPYWRGEGGVSALDRVGRLGMPLGAMGNSITVMLKQLIVPGAARQWWLALRLCALALIVVAVPACSFFGKEEVIPDDAADKLYNEGLYLLNTQRDFKKAAK